MKRWMTGFLTIMLMTGGTALHAEPASRIPVTESAAYARFQKRPANELSKLIYLIERFEEFDVKVVLDGRNFESDEASSFSRNYLFKNYDRKDKAASWIKTHVYRSRSSGEIIYFLFPDGHYLPARDILLQELKSLEAGYRS